MPEPEIDRESSEYAPSVSVIIDVDGEAPRLDAAVESVLQQSWPDIELIITVAAHLEPALSTAEMHARRYARVRAISRGASLGLAQRWNAGLALARGAYIKYLHPGDAFCTPNALRSLLEVCQGNPAISVVSSARHVSLAIPLTTLPDQPKCDYSTSGAAMINRCILQQANLIGEPWDVLFRRCLAGRGFDGRYSVLADLEMWFRLLEQGCVAHLRAPLIDSPRNPGRQNAAGAPDWLLLLAEYLDKPYIRLRPSLKKRLRYDAIQQAKQYARFGNVSPEANVLLKDFGKDRKWTEAFVHPLWKLSRSLAREWDSRSLPPAPNCERRRIAKSRPLGFNVAGFLKAEYGVGESSRAFSRAVAETGLPCAPVNIHAKDHRNADESVTTGGQDNPYSINLMTFSFDYARRFYLDKGPRYFEGRHNIALWYWEQERFPVRWHCDYDYYDEIWVPTRFCQQAIAAASPVPVRRITYPLAHIESGSPDRAAFGLPESATVFLFTFDYFSTIARKNPIGVAKAFQRAFRGSEDVLLVIKSINGSARPEDRAMLGQVIADPRIRCLESHLSGAQLNSLMASCDSYVSLHRCEGLGLGMAQAMAQAKPVIATGYSGNLEYMNAANSLLVDYQIVTLDRDYGVYEAGSRWAEPDLDHAAERLRWVYDNPVESAEIGRIGQQSIRRTLDPEVTRREIMEHVREITREDQA